MATQRPTPPVTSPARWALPLALLAVAIAFGATAVQVFTDVDDSFRYGGDQAMAGLAVDEAGSFDRDLGPYSRYGWSHPGPFWFYLLTPASRLLGGDDAALIAANVLVNGLLAAALVIAVHRRGRAARTLAVTALVLAFVLRMPRDFFVDAWSPFALLMGTLLFLVLAARVYAGRWSTLLAMLVAGSFLVQTHVGTGPLVVLVSAVGGVAFFLARRELRRTPGPEATAPDIATSEAAPDGPPEERRWWTLAVAALLVVVWIPPLVQQLSSPLRQGNIVRLVSFLLHHEDPNGSPTLGQAVVGVGRVLAMTPYGWDAGPLRMDVDGMPAPVALVLVLQVAVSAALVVLGLRWGSRSGLWWGVLTLTALVAAILAADTVTGLLFWYLIVWVAALPVATVIGLVHLVFDARATRRAPGPDRRVDRTPVLAALAVVVLAGAVMVAVSLGDAVEDLPESTEATTAYALVEPALADVEGRSLHVDMTPHELWPIGAGIVRGLVSEGWTVTVDPEFADLFGSGRTAAGRGPVDLLLVSTDGPEHVRLQAEPGVRDLGSFPTQYGPVSILVREDD